MRGIARQVLEKARLWNWRRHQGTSQELRQWYREHQRVDVGLYSYGCFDHWRMPGPLVIGRYCSIAKTVRSAPINHPFDAMTTHPALYERKFGVVDTNIHYDDPQIIEDDVWIGHNAMILPSCRRVGRGSVIGAGAIVTKDVPRYSIVAGNPARLIRERFTPELQAALEASQWWTLDFDGLRKLVREDPDLVMKPTVERVSAWMARRTHGK